MNAAVCKQDALLAVTAVHLREPFSQEVARVPFPVGSTIESTMPKARSRLICRLNGSPLYVPRSQWDYRLCGGDVIEWEEHPSGGEADGGALQIVLGIVASIVSMNPYPAILAFASVAVGMASTRERQERYDSESPTYATGLQGNQARLYSVVPKICGRHHTFPPFASQPYQEFDADGEQYLYVLLALGIGNHEIERILIDDTDITHFSDVLTASYLPPGTPPATVIPNVINSPEVGNQDMLTGEYIGGFSACAPRSLASHIGIDVIAPYGIGIQDAETGELGNLTVIWRVEVRPINEFGTAVGPWSELAEETRTAANREPQRWTVKYELSTPARVEVRILRTDAKSTNVRHLNDLNWSAMRAYLAGEVTLNPHVAHIEVVMRASKQLSNVSQNRIAVIATGMCRELLPDGTLSSDEIASRNPADWLADLWTSTTWGEGLDESKCDLATLATYKAIWAARQDRFDFVFDTATSAEEAGQIIAEAGRARCFRRGGMRTLVRDQLVTLPRTAFTTRNTLPGSMYANEVLPVEDLPDGLIVEYFDNRSWNFGQTLECPVPGVTTMTRPMRIRLLGVTGANHAKREGLYRAARMVLRRRTVECVTEMQGILPAFGSLVRWQSETTRWQSGDVVSWDEATLTMRLTEPPDWSVSPQHIVFIGDDGLPTTPIAVTPGALNNSVTLASAPAITIVTDDGTRDRTQYLIGGLGDDEELVKISSIEDGGTSEEGAQLHRISAFVDDDRVHAADNAYLPNPGEIQDPIDTSPGEPGGGSIPIVNILNYEAFSAGNGSQVWEFRADGTAWHNFTTGAAYERLDQQWLYAAPSEAPLVQQFEVYFELITYAGDALGLEHMGSWLPCGTVDYVFGGTTASEATSLVEFFVYVRDAATQTLQGQARIGVGKMQPVGG